MKQVITILMTAFALTALTAFAAEPATAPTEKSKQGMKLAKKKDHSKVKKDATKSSADKKAADKKSK